MHVVIMKSLRKNIYLRPRCEIVNLKANTTRNILHSLKSLRNPPTIRTSRKTLKALFREFIFISYSVALLHSYLLKKLFLISFHYMLIRSLKKSQVKVFLAQLIVRRNLRTRCCDILWSANKKSGWCRTS